MGCFCLFLLVGCGGSSAKRVSSPEPPSEPVTVSRKPVVVTQPKVSYEAPKPTARQIDQCWQPLVQRLQKDPRVPPEAVAYFYKLSPYSPEPMGTKVRELYNYAFATKPRVPDDGKPKPPPSTIYRDVVTAASMQKCKDFLERNKKWFAAAEKNFPVPKEVLVALLYVETRLGGYVGKRNAFWSLACMAAATTPAHVKGGTGNISLTSAHTDWLQAKLNDKSEWAYKELWALLSFCSAQDLDPHRMPGSVYGAIGLCQFMPSNLVPYGKDGNGDGSIDLFTEPDAIFSAANYLTKHGWKAGMGLDQQRNVLKRYNNLNIYANTILALGESVRTGVVQTRPPARPLRIQ